MGVDPEILKLAETRIGTTLRDKYRIDSILGVGGMAVVYRATHRNQAELAVKMLLPDLAMRESLRKRFVREGYVANSVKHPGVVAVIDDDMTEDGAAFLVMELLHGTSLDALATGRRMSVPAASAILDQLLDVLAAAHAKGIVHRDIKPGNLFLTTDGTLKVLDFGIARLRDTMSGDDSNMTGTGELLGTPGFMAPEQARGEKTIDARTDLWSAGATFFKLVSGQIVHEGANAAQVMIATATSFPRSVTTVANLPAAVARVIDRSLAFTPASRWQTASEMQESLRATYSAAFGFPPSRASLTPQAVEAAAQEMLPEVGLATAHTAPAVSTSPLHTLPSAPPASRMGLPLQLLLGVLVAAASVVSFRVWTAKSSTAAEPTVIIVPATQVAAAPTTTTTPSASPPGAPVVTTAASVKKPAIVVTAAVHPQSRPAPTSACDPPFYFDADNKKIFKKECL